MELLLSDEDHFGYLNQCINNSLVSVSIASYGFFAGILPDGRDTRSWGKKFKSETREFLEKLRKVKNVRILVGTYEYKSCKGKITRCIDCEIGYVKNLIRLINHVEIFPEFKWRTIAGSHIKCTVFTYKDGDCKGIIGGRNFTGSSWIDATVVLERDNILKITEHFVKSWKTATQLDSSKINTLLEEQEISPSIIDHIVQ